MTVQAITPSRRLAKLTQLPWELEHSRTPEETLRKVRESFAETDGLAATVMLSTHGLPPRHYRILRIESENQGPEGDLFNGHDRELEVYDGGVMGEIILRPQPQMLVDVDWSTDPVFSECLRGCGSVLAIPIVGEHLPMNWAILLRRTPDRFNVSDMEEAVERAALVGALVENQILAARLAEAHERISNEARRVGELQRSLLPAAMPQDVGLQIAASYEPSGRAGGDLYDFFPIGALHGKWTGAQTPPDRWCIFMGDTQGNGLHAAVVMAIVQAILHAHPAGTATPSGLLAHANQQLCTRGIHSIVTAFLGIYEPATRTLTYANAGHPPPLLRRGGHDAIRPLDAVGSYPLGIDAAEVFDEATIHLDRGDLLLLYTDGITEARGISDELFGLERLEPIFQSDFASPAELIERIRQAVKSHQNNSPATDDQTLVAARVA